MPTTPVRIGRGSAPERSDAVEPGAEATEIGPPPLDAMSRPERVADAESVQRLVTAYRAGADDALVGQVIGEAYRIVRPIGEGGMARVYEATHRRLEERRFAIKVLRPELVGNEEMTARFLREAQAVSAIRHPGIIDVLDVARLSDGRPYLVSEYLEGEDLADCIGRCGPLRPAVAAGIAAQLCRALSAAHAHGIIHRDLKPGNVFVVAAHVPAGTAPLVKVLDFGISKALDGFSDLTKTGMIVGTPSFMAPEQALGNRVDQRSDVFALGACLYFMTTGRRPFESDDTTAMLRMLVRSAPMSPRKIDAGLPVALEKIILRAMAKRPQDRYPTMEAFEHALLGFSAAGAPEAAAPARRGKTADRRTVVLYSLALGGWAVSASVAALAGLVRLLHDGEVTLAESLLLGLGCLAAAATPVALYVGHLKRAIWPSSRRTARLAASLELVLTAVLATYGGLAIVGRVGHTVLLRASTGISSGLWDIALLVATAVAVIASGGARAFHAALRRRPVE